MQFRQYENTKQNIYQPYQPISYHNTNVMLIPLILFVVAYLTPGI